MFSGSYDPDDVTFLLRPVDFPETPLAEKERLIQSGQRHYSEMITRERLPSEKYLQVFHEGVQREKTRLARDLIKLAAIIAESRTGPLTLVSLARAGTPIGVLLTRTLRRHFGRQVAHYSVSIIRDRGIDRVALRFILDRHPADSIAFVDGWTGKGVIARELEGAIRDFNAAFGLSLDPGLFAIADLSGTAGGAATSEDYLIPSCVLGATISGLVSRSILNEEVVRDQDFHACLFYSEFQQADLSRWFADVMSEVIAQEWSPVRGEPGCVSSGRGEPGCVSSGRGEPGRAGSVSDGTGEPGCVSSGRGLPERERARLRGLSAEFLAHVAGVYGVRDVNFIKPGIGEATRVLLRRVPDRVLLRDPDVPEVAHLRVLAAEKDVPVVVEPNLPYRAAALIKELDG